MDRQVIDATGLTGQYDIAFDLTPEDYNAIVIRSGVNAGVVLPPQALRALDLAASDPFSGPLQKFGLTLGSRKAPLDLIVVPATAGAIASHILLDTLTFSGCPLLWPFTRHRFSVRLCRYDNTLVNFVISALSVLGIAAYIVYA
jgi:hypothetical protein